MKRSILVSALALVSVSQVWAVFGNPSSLDTIYTSVGKLGGASCVAIDPHWILTARHIDGDTFVIDGGTYHSTGQDFADTVSDLRVIQVTETIPTADIAKLGLNSSYVGQTATLVGYGNSGTGITGNTYNVGGVDGERHSAFNRLDSIEQIDFGQGETPWDAYIYDLDDPNGVGNGYVTGEGGIWSGDSGGGWFVTTGNGPVLVAISAGNAGPDAGGPANQFGGFGAGTTIASHSAFIASHVPGAVPEPASMTALAIGGIGMLLKKRRSRA